MVLLLLDLCVLVITQYIMTFFSAIGVLLITQYTMTVFPAIDCFSNSYVDDQGSGCQRKFYRL